MAVCKRSWSFVSSKALQNEWGGWGLGLFCFFLIFIHRSTCSHDLIKVRFAFLLFVTSPTCVLQDKWLLHSVLMLVQSSIKPLVYLQTTMAHYDYASEALLNKTKWMLEKLISLEQGVVVLIKKVGQRFYHT